MRVLVTALATICGATLALLALAAFNLHVFVDAHRDELIARIGRACGRSVAIRSVTPGWWPVGIRLGDVVVDEDPRFGAGAFLTANAARIAVRPDLLILGRVEVSRLVLESPRIALIRDASGRWNAASVGAVSLGDGAGEDGGSAGPRSHRRHEGRVRLPWIGLAATDVHDGRLEIEDRSGGSVRRIAISSVRLRASALRLGEDARVRIDAAMAPDAVAPDTHVDLRIARLGMQDEVQTPFVARVEFENADLATAAVIAGRREPWAGRIGSLVAEATGGLEHFFVDVALRANAPLRFGPHLPLPRVAIQIDARAEVVRDRLRLEHASGAFGPLQWTAEGDATWRPWHLELTLQSVADSTAPLGAGQPPLALSDLSVAIFADDSVRIAPARARLDDVRVDGAAQITGLDPLVFAAQVHATGFGGAFDGSLDADSADGARARVEATALDVGAIARRWLARQPVVTGRLDAAASGTVPWGAADPLRAFGAEGTLRLADGTLSPVNVAEHVLRRTPASRLLPQIVSATTRTRFPEVFDALGTGIRSAAVPFTVAGGTLRSPTVTVHADAYDIDGDASVDLATRDLRFRGDLALSPELSAALREDLPPLRYLARRDGRLVMPFRMHGPLSAPVPEALRGARVPGLDAARGGRENRGNDAESEAAEDDPRVQRLDRMLHP